MLLVQAKPVRDDPDHLPVCYRCGSANPLLNPFSNRFAKGDVCTNCGHPFVRSFINFDVLPLVEFVPDPSISDEEAIDMIRQPPHAGPGPAPGTYNSRSADNKKNQNRPGKEAKGGGWKESKTGNAEVLTFGGSSGSRSGAKDEDGNEDEEINEDAVHEALGVNANESDLFTRCLNLTLERQKSNYTPVKVDANTLFAMKRSEVITSLLPLSKILDCFYFERCLFAVRLQRASEQLSTRTCCQRFLSRFRNPATASSTWRTSSLLTYRSRDALIPD